VVGSFGGLKTVYRLFRKRFSYLFNQSRIQKITSIYHFPSQKLNLIKECKIVASLVDPLYVII
jgi:hypothetical protein